MKTARGGNDMVMTTLGFYEAAIRAVREGRLEESVLDEAVRHILTVKCRMNLFEKPEKKGAPGCIGCEEHLASALDAARKSVTLLRNGGMLPLRAGIRKVAVIGPNADSIQNQYGDWTYFTHPVPHTGHPPVRPYVTVKEGFEKLCAERGIELVYHEGCAVKASPADNIPGAVAAARGADAIFLVLGDEESQFGEGKDRANLDLSGRQMELFRALRALGVPLATVLVSSKPLCLGDAAEKADAVICGFNGGMFGGQAVAEAAFGLFNPSGRLPISFPRHSGQVPVYYNQLPGWHGWPGAAHYCDLPVEPLFAFGEGLGYTTFAYENLTFDPQTMTAEATVTNTGDREGTETVQVYFRDMASSVLTPVKRLIAFRQLTLRPGETARVRFQLRREDFALVNRAERTVVEPGDFTLFIGHSAKDEDLLSTAFTL